MDEPLFANKSHRPTEAELAKALGPAKRSWDGLVASLRDGAPQCAADWKHYAGKTGWVFVARRQRRNVLYLKPLERRFLASLALSDAEVRAAEQADLPPELVESIRTSPKYPEGRPARVEVSTAADAKIVRALLAIKLGS